MSYHSLQAHQAVMPPTRELFFWDFDGVICDSVRETAQAGFLTCLQLWPELRGGAADGGGPAAGDVDLTTQAPPGVVEGFKRIRPLLHTGWEAVVMVRLLLEAGDAAGAEETAAGITAGWSAATCTGHLEKWGAAQAAVMDSFNTVRRRWIESDRASWTAMHGSYATPLAAFRVLAAEVPGQTYIVTTKSAEFVHAILAHWGVEGFDDAHIFGLGSGDKLETVHRVVKEHEAAATASAGHAADHVRALGKLVRVPPVSVDVAVGGN